MNKLDFSEYQHIKVKLACSEVKNTDTHKSQTYTNEKFNTMADEDIDRVMYNGWF